MYHKTFSMKKGTVFFGGLLILVETYALSAQPFTNGIPIIPYKSDAAVLFGKDIVIFPRPERNQRASDILAVFNGWLYAANTNDDYPEKRITLFRSINNGMTWDSIGSCCLAYEHEMIPEITLTYTGNSENNLKVYACWIYFDTIYSTSFFSAAKFNGVTGAIEPAGWFNSQNPNDVKIDNNSSIGANIIAFLIDMELWPAKHGLFLRYSTDEGNTFHYTKIIEYAYPKEVKSVSLSYGFSPITNTGRFFAVWRVDDTQNAQTGRIYTAHSEPDFNSPFTSPVCIDNLNSSDINLCRNPVIVCQKGNMVNDSANLTTVILYERYDENSGTSDLKGYYNLQSISSNYFKPLSFTNSSHNNIQADADFNPYDSTFMVTWFDSTTQKLRCVMNKMNMTNPNSWMNVSSGYNDQPVTNAPHPRITIHPFEQSCANTWIAEGGNGNGIALFDALYSTYNFIPDSQWDIGKVKILPNPCSDYFMLGFYSNIDQTVDITIRSILGCQVKRFGSFNCFIGNNTFKLNTTEFPSGTYIINVSTKNNSCQCKLIIKK